MSRPLLELRNVSKLFAGRRRSQRGLTQAPAVDRVSLGIGAGESVGIAGESGSGKTTLAWMILQLLPVTSGQILFDGEALADASDEALMRYRRDVQAVFQDSASALNPRMRVRDLIAEPLIVQQSSVNRAEVDFRIDELLGRVALPLGMRDCFPHELSGGQKQRVALARSLIVYPRMLVLDEPVSALDVSVRSQVLNLLLDLQEERRLAYVMISHDLAILRHVTTRVVVMYLGRVVELGPTEEVLFSPQHPYTRALVAASPTLVVNKLKSPILADRESVNAESSGCQFAPRCPLAERKCHQSAPELAAVGEATDRTHLAACHLTGLQRI